MIHLTGAGFTLERAPEEMTRMLSRLLTLTTLGAAIGCGLIGGVFFAFSTFVMPALARLPPSQGVLAMQTINITVINKWFLGAFVGTAVLCPALILSSVFSIGETSSRLRIAGAVLYLFGTLLVTGAGNVPLNESLATIPPESAEAAATWTPWVSRWNTWNHVRTGAALAAATLLVLALVTRKDSLRTSSDDGTPRSGGSPSAGGLASSP